MEGVPKNESIFNFPNLQDESGEIERVAVKFNPQNPEAFVASFYESAKQGQLVDLTEEVWSTLGNTDSFDISRHDWDQVAQNVDHTNQETGSTRNWQDLKHRMETGQELNAPIILRLANETHLVSGNTRLMVARALGKTPTVLIVGM